MRGARTRAALAMAGVLLGAGAAQADRIKNPTAIFSGLDKITGRIVSFEVAVDETVQFGSLQMTAKVCYSKPPNENPNTTAFVEVDDTSLGDKGKRVFSGWMFAASPGLHGMEHPVYDIWLVDCKGGTEVIAEQKVAPEELPPIRQEPAAAGRQPLSPLTGDTPSARAATDRADAATAASGAARGPESTGDQQRAFERSLKHPWPVRAMCVAGPAGCGGFSGGPVGVTAGAKRRFPPTIGARGQGGQNICAADGLSGRPCIPVRLLAHGGVQKALVVPPGNLDRAELREVRCHELGIEQREAAPAQAGDEMSQRHLRSVAFLMEHALAEESLLKPDPVEAPDQTSVPVDFHRVTMAGIEQGAVELADAPADPGFLPVVARSGAAGDDPFEVVIDPDREDIRTDGACETPGDLKPVERYDSALAWLDPEQGRIVHILRHRKDARRIGLEQNLGSDFDLIAAH